MEVRIENSTAKKCVQHYQKRMGNIYVSSNIEEPQENPFNDIDKPLDNLAIAYQTVWKYIYIYIVYIVYISIYIYIYKCI